MGYYIETGQASGKVAALQQHHGATTVSEGEALQHLQSGKGVVCVVDNGIFDAAAFVYDAYEYSAFADRTDTRPKTWMVMDRAKAESLSGYAR